MTDATLLVIDPPKSTPRFYMGWLTVVVAAVAMVATLPGRTYGLGIITESLLHEFNLSPTQFATQNLIATLVGAAFGLALGPLVDRVGARVMLTLTLVALGVTVVTMGSIHGALTLLLMITLTRGFGQSNLSTVSLALVGKWFSRRLPIAMAVFSLIVGLGFSLAIPLFSHAVQVHGWKSAWVTLGWVLVLVLAPLAWIATRRTPESVGLMVDGSVAETAASTPAPSIQNGATLEQALSSPAFWAYALSASAFGLVNSGVMLFNESVLREHGIEGQSSGIVLGVIMLCGMFANFLGGWLAGKWPIGRLMAIAMFMLSLGLFSLPFGHGRAMVYLYAVMMGLSAGIVTVAFFICWGKVFGRRHLGAIQGAAQGLTVLASALGPLMLAECSRRFHSTTPLFFTWAPIIAVLGLFCAVAPTPNWTEQSSRL